MAHSLWELDFLGYSLTAMIDRLILPLLALVAFAMIALALVWPQGTGLPSPALFGSAPARSGPPLR